MRYCFTTTLNPKRSFVKCVYHQVQRIVIKPSAISQGKKHLHCHHQVSLLIYTRNHRSQKKKSPTKESMTEYKLPWLYTLCQRSPVRLLPTTILKYLFVWPKHTVVPAKRAGGVLRIPCECGKVCNEKIGRGATTMNDTPVHNPLLFLRTPTTPTTFHLILN